LSLDVTQMGTCSIPVSMLSSLVTGDFTDPLREQGAFRKGQR
jgi:hypothetical protein